MPKVISNGEYANNLLKLIFNATAYTGIADNAASPITSLYCSLHIGSPTSSGNQTTNEAAYPGYARVAVSRSTSGWTVTNNIVTPVSNIDFPTATGGEEVITYFGIGTAATGTGHLLYFCSISPLKVSINITPQFTTSSAISEI